jgi:hypothetical protein
VWQAQLPRQERPFRCRQRRSQQISRRAERVLDSPTYEVVCCRFVSHLTTADHTEITLGHVTVVPESDGFGGLMGRIAAEIPRGHSAFNREEPRPFAKPHTLLVIRERTDHADPHEVAQRLSNKLERFLMLARLFTAGTVYSNFEVSGITTSVSRMTPHLSDLRGSRALVRRIVRPTAGDSAAFEAIGALVDEADVKRDGMAATSFDVALVRFNSSHHQENHYETLVDLATALEAILAGGENDTEGLTLRLRNRTAALLATDHDPATAIFGDVGVLYGLRSKLVHAARSSKATCAATLDDVSRRQPRRSAMRDRTYHHDEPPGSRVSISR